MNFASSDIRSGLHGGSHVSSVSTVLDALQARDDLADLLLDHRADRAAHRREAVGDVRLRPVDLGVVEEAELDDVHSELRVLDDPQRFEDLLACRHA